MAKFRPDMRQFNNKNAPVTVYSSRGKLYMRRKSSLTGKRVKTDPAFKRTMEFASLFAIASRIASAVYKIIVPSKKKRELYNAITGRAMALVRGSGRSEQEIRELLIGQYR